MRVTVAVVERDPACRIAARRRAGRAQPPPELGGLLPDGLLPLDPPLPDGLLPPRRRARRAAARSAAPRKRLAETDRLPDRAARAGRHGHGHARAAGGDREGITDGQQIAVDDALRVGTVSVAPVVLKPASPPPLPEPPEPPLGPFAQSTLTAAVPQAGKGAVSWKNSSGYAAAAGKRTSDHCRP